MSRFVSVRRQSPAAFIALAILTSLLALSAPAEARAARPSLVAPKGSTVGANPVFTWRQARGAASYDVEIAKVNSFRDTVFDDRTENLRVVPTKQLPIGRLFWRVRSISESGSPSRWTVSSFTRGQLAGPTSLAPANGAILSQPSNPPLLRWLPISGAEKYLVEVDGAEQDWIDTTTYTTETSSLVVPDPQAPGTYAWRVKAYLDDGVTTRASAARTYAVGALPVVGPASPSGTDAGVDDVVFEWDPVPGAISYDIRVSPDNSFNEIIDQRAVKSTRYSPTTTYDNANYYWQVRARNIFGQAQEWNEVEVRVFRRAWSPTPTGPRIDQVALTYPADKTVVGDDFYYEWTPVPLASRYRLDVGTDKTFTTSFETCFTVHTVFTPEEKCFPDRQGETYYWRVQALDDPRGVNSVLSEVRAFQYDRSRVQLVSPAPGESVSLPTFRWEPVDDTHRYILRLTSPGGSVRTETTYSYSYTPDTKLSEGTWTWTVQSVGRNGTVSPLPLTGRSVTITAPPANTASSPTPTSSASTTPRFPVLTWSPVTDATSYRLFIADQGSPFFTEAATRYAYPAGTDTTDDWLIPGTYDWYVDAYKGSTRIASGQGGPLGTFTISNLDATTGQQIALTGAKLDTGSGTCARALSSGVCEDTRATPVLDWSSVPDASRYVIYLSYDREFTNLVYGNKADVGSLPWTQNTRWIPTEALPETQAGQAYYWFVRPCISSCALPEPTLANHAFRKKSAEVERLAPLDGASVANDVTFTWRDYLGTNQDHLNPLTGEAVSQAAKSYRIQVSTSPAFGSLVDNKVVDQRTYTPFDRTYPEGTLYWRIQAIDGSGNGLSWSPAWRFVKQSPSPTLSSPADGATVSGTQPLSWVPLNFAGSYQVEVYENGDRNASSTNRRLSATSRQTSYSPKEPLPTSTRPYVWRVRRLDADKRPGAWSGWRSFYVSGAAPALVSPRAGATVPKRFALFTWRPSSGAVSYEVQLRKRTTIKQEVRTVASSWAPTEALERGKWQWRVLAYDSSGNLIRGSAWRGFTAR